MDSPSSQFGDQWSLAEGMWHNNLPIIMRMRLELDDYVGSPQFPVGYRITWKFANPTEHGYPSASDHDLMEPFETKLLSAFEDSGTAIVAAVVTHNGERDYVCYTADPDALHALFNETFSSKPVKPLSFAAAPDPDWQEYLGMRAQIEAE